MDKIFNPLLILVLFVTTLILTDSCKKDEAKPAPSPGDLNVVVCDVSQSNYFGGAEVFLYLSSADRTNDPQRTSYYRKATTDNSDPIFIGAAFYKLNYQKYYVFARHDLGFGNLIVGEGESFITSGQTTKLTVVLE